MPHMLHSLSFFKKITYTLFSLIVIFNSLHAHDFIIRTSRNEEYPIAKTPETLNVISNYDEIKEQKKHKNTQKQKAKEFTIFLPSGIEISVSYFLRESSKLMVIGQGFQNSKENVYYLAHLFSDYDVVVFNYRWNNMLRFLLKPSTLLNMLNESILKEKEEVFAVVNHIKQQKTYDCTIGLAICYSTYPFLDAYLDAQQHGIKIFDKLILDSCFCDISLMTEKIALDPCMICEPQKDHTPRFQKWLVNKLFISTLLTKLITFRGDASLTPLLSKVYDIPLLLIHGQNDIFIPEDQLDEIWNSIQTDSKCLFLTPYTHVKNMTNLGMYKFVCEQFIECNLQQFIEKFPVEHQNNY